MIDYKITLNSDTLWLSTSQFWHSVSFLSCKREFSLLLKAFNLKVISWAGSFELLCFCSKKSIKVISWAEIFELLCFCSKELKNHKFCHYHKLIIAVKGLEVSEVTEKERFFLESLQQTQKLEYVTSFVDIYEASIGCHIFPGVYPLDKK